MARTPKIINIKLQDLMMLLNYRWAAVNSDEVGELGSLAHEELLMELDKQCSLQITASQLADLVYHMKEVIFEKVHPKKIDYRIKNHNVMMRRLKQQIPQLFKEDMTGEIVMVDFENRR